MENQYSPMTLSRAGLINALSPVLKVPTGSLSLALSMAKISSAESTNWPLPGTCTSGAMISTGSVLARRGITTDAPVLLEI